MKRALHVVALVALAACAGQHPATSSMAREPAVDPSSLSPVQLELVQRSLIDRGFPVDLTGSFDPPTRTALIELQRARGLPALGEIDSATAEALGIDPRELMPAHGQASAAPGATPGATEGTANGPDEAGTGGRAPARAPEREGEGPGTGR